MILQAVTPEAAYAVGLQCRPRDRQEFGAATGIRQPDELAQWMGERYGSLDGLLTASDDEGELICVGGAIHVRPGTCALLFYATDSFEEIALSMTRFIKRQYFPQLEAGGYHRIECVTSAAYPEMQKWLEILGMKREGLLRAYGAGGEDFVQYARVSFAGGHREQ
jgi:hypothetical protein